LGFCFIQAGGSKQKTGTNFMGDEARNFSTYIGTDYHLNFNVPEKDVDFLIMNFAIHYMFDSKKNVENIVNLVDSLIMKDGYFMFTTMSGEKVFDFLKDINYDKSKKLKENSLNS